MIEKFYFSNISYKNKDKSKEIIFTCFLSKSEIFKLLIEEQLLSFNLCRTKRRGDVAPPLLNGVKGLVCIYRKVKQDNFKFSLDYF